MDLKEFPAMVVKRFGIHNINPLADHFSSTDESYLAAFRKAVADAGSHMVDLGLGGRNFYTSDAAKRSEAIGYGRKWIDIAVIVGSPSVRQHLSVSLGAKPDANRAAESLGQLAEYGAKRNIIVNLENDSAVAEDPFVIEFLTQRDRRKDFERAAHDRGNGNNRRQDQ